MTNAIARRLTAIGGALMVRSGQVGILGTTGAKTGLARRAPIGFVARPDGSILIGSGSRVNRGWAANLEATPEATFTIKGVERGYEARLAADGERTATLAELKISMGSVAGRADWGDLFILEPPGPVLEPPGPVLEPPWPGSGAARARGSDRLAAALRPQP